MFKCQGLGHIVTDCPNRKVITLAEWEAVKEGDLEDEKEEGIDIQGEET